MAYRTGVSTSRGLSSLADHVGVSPVPLFDRVLRGKASKRAQQEAGEGPVFRQAYLDAVGVWMDAATG